MNTSKLLENIRNHFLNVLNFDIDFNIIRLLYETRMFMDG